jgi:uncharacterized protein YktA (UPF0223 family)
MAEKILMLFLPQYNYIEKLTIWTGVAHALKTDKYKPFKEVPSSQVDEKFVHWLQARAIALYQILQE